MHILTRNYDFYKLGEENRKALIDNFFVEKDDLDGLGEIKCAKYFPIQLKEEESWLNYGVKQGILLVIPIQKHYKIKSNWFRVACFSPDDLDLDLNFENNPTEDFRQEVIELIKEMPKDEVGYRECLEFIKFYFGGEIN